MPSQNSPDSQSDRPKSNKTLLAIAIIVIVVTATVIVIFFRPSEIHPLPTPVIYTIVDGNLVINAGSYEYYNFTVPSGEPNSKVEGTFTVTGSEKINVYVMDSANFTDWQNGHNASMYYDSGEVSNDNVTVTLPSSGIYYLVYDNTFAATSKNVTTQVDYYYPYTLKL